MGIKRKHELFLVVYKQQFVHANFNFILFYFYLIFYLILFLLQIDVFCFHRRKESAKTLDNCESIIEDATKYLQENNMTRAYLRLANVLQKDHRSEKHKEMEKKALDIVINALGKSLTPGILNIGVIVTISY